MDCKLTTEKVSFFSPKDEVVRLRGTQQPAALTATILIECTRPCTDLNTAEVSHSAKKKK